MSEAPMETPIDPRVDIGHVHLKVAAGATGLYHFAIRYPDRVSEALYLRDPDGNGVELYRDRPRDEWPRQPDGAVTMYTRRLDLAALSSEA